MAGYSKYGPLIAAALAVFPMHKAAAEAVPSDGNLTKVEACVAEAVKATVPQGGYFSVEKGKDGFEINGLQEKDPSGQHPETLVGVKAYGNGEKLYIDSIDDGTITADNGASSFAVSIEANAQNVQAPANLLAKSGSTVTAEQRENVTGVAKKVLGSVRKCALGPS